MDNINDLLKPRIIVENNYPRSPFKHHEIIFEPSAEQIEWAKEFPLNFRFLNWWEHRDESEMPEYVKAVLGKLIGVWKIIRWDMEQKRGFIDDNSIVSLDSMTFPATPEEYTHYTNNKKEMI